MGYVHGLKQGSWESIISSKSFIRHIVFFNAKDKADVLRIVKGLSRLRDIAYASVFEVCENMRTDALSNEVDVVVYAEFPNLEALRAYKQHPIYQETVVAIRPLRELRIAADI